MVLAGRGLELLEARIVLPDEALELRGTVRQLAAGLREDLVRLRLVHVVGLALAALVELVSLNEGARQWIELLELKVARGLIVT